MNYMHRADCEIAKWLSDCAEGKTKKKASAINTTMMPYALSERADQLKSAVLQDALESIEQIKIAGRSDVIEKYLKSGDKIIANTDNNHGVYAYVIKNSSNLKLIIFKVFLSRIDDEEHITVLENTSMGLGTIKKPSYSSINSYMNDNKDGYSFEKMWYLGDSKKRDTLKNILGKAIEEQQAEEEQKDVAKDESSDIEKRIADAKTPEELEAIEKELSDSSSSSDSEAPTSDQSAEQPAQPEQPAAGGEEKPKEGGEAKPTGDPAVEIEGLKKDIKDLKGQLEKLTGEEKLKNDVKEMKEKLDNIVVQDDPSLNNTINQSASKIKYFKRALRRALKKTASNDEKQKINDEIENIKSQIGRSDSTWKRLYSKERPLSAAGWRHKEDQKRRKEKLIILKKKLKEAASKGFDITSQSASKRALRRIAEKLTQPIIPDAIKLLSKNQNAEKFTNKSKFENFLEKQKYFSASESHCFYTEKQHKDFLKGQAKSEDKCYMLFETGRVLVAVWDDKNSIGYILPDKFAKNAAAGDRVIVDADKIWERTKDDVKKRLMSLSLDMRYDRTVKKALLTYSLSEIYKVINNKAREIEIDNLPGLESLPLDSGNLRDFAKMILKWDRKQFDKHPLKGTEEYLKTGADPFKEYQEFL